MLISCSVGDWLFNGFLYCARHINLVPRPLSMHSRKFEKALGTRLASYSNPTITAIARALCQSYTRNFRGKINVIYHPWSVRIEKNFALGLEYMDHDLRPQSLDTFFFSLYGPSSR